MKKIVFILANLLFTNLSFAETETPISPKLQHSIEKLESKKNELQGGAIAILHRGQVIYKTTFGNQKGNEGAITSSTLFPLASVSKPVSTAAIALLVDKGQLRLDEKIQARVSKNQSEASKHLESHHGIPIFWQYSN